MKRLGGGLLLTLTDHFRRRWQARVGAPVPAPEDVERLLESAITLQRFRQAYTMKRKPITILELYWVPEVNIVIKVDAARRQAVTVIAGDVVCQRRN